MVFPGWVLPFCTQVAKHLGPIWVLSGLTGAHMPHMNTRWDPYGRSEYTLSKTNPYEPHMGPICVVLGTLNRYYPRTTHIGPISVVLGNLNRNYPRTTHVGPTWAPYICFSGQVSDRNPPRTTHVGPTWVPYVLFWALWIDIIPEQHTWAPYGPYMCCSGQSE